MARLVTTGFETQRYGTVAQCSEGQGLFSSGTVTADTEHQWDGTACAKCAAGGENRVGIESSTLALGTTYYPQAAMRIASGTVSANTAIFNVFAAVSLELLLLTNGKLSLWNNKSGSNVLSEFFTPEREKTYLYEMKLLVPTSGNSTVQLKIRNEAGEVKYESSEQSIVYGNTKITFVEAGHKGSDANCPVYVSHLVLNDSTGASETSFPGFQKVAMLKPVSDSANTKWTRSTSGTTTELFKGVNHAPPAGVVYASRTAESQIVSPEAAETNLYKANLQSYTEAGVSGTVKATMAIARIGQSATTSRTVTLTMTNPTGSESRGSSSTAAGTDPTGWSSQTIPAVYTAPTLGTQPTLQIAKQSVSALVMVDLLAIYASFEPSTSKTVEGEAAIAGVGTVSAAGTVVSPGPTITTETSESVTNVGATTAVTWSGTVTTAYIEYGSTTGYGTKVEATKSKEALLASKALTGLSENSTYHWRAVLVGPGGTTNGSDQTFTTSGKPGISYTSPTSITGTGATIHGLISGRHAGKGVGKEVFYFVEWGTTTSYTSSSPEAATEPGEEEPVSYSITGLTSGVTYHYRISAENAYGITHGEDQTFTTGHSTVEGKAAITGTGTVAAKGTRLTFGKAGVTGTGTIHAAGTIVSPETPPVVPVVQPDPRPNTALSVRVTTATGSSYRWGPDEWDALNIPQSLTFGTAMPGGFDTLSVSLPRRIDRDYPDLNLLDSIEVLGPGNRVVWEGRIQQLPRSHQDTWSITVGAVGWSAHLMDDTSFREVYVDRELGNWTTLPSSARQIALRGTGFAPVAANVTPDPTSQLPSLDLMFEGAWNGVTPINEPFYDTGPGLRVGHMYADWVLNTGDTSFVLAGFVADDSLFTSAEGTGDFASGPTSGHALYAPGHPRRVVGWQWYYGSSTAGGASVQYAAMIRRLAVFGDHGVPLIGAEAELGVAASAVIENVLGRAATLLVFDDDSIEETTFPIPQLAFREATTAQAVIERVNAFHLFEFGVYEDRKFFFREPDPTRLCWEARLSDGATLDLEGTQVADIYNGVIVQFTDAAGESKTAGPIGSGCDYEDSRLEDKSELNVVNQHGIPKKWMILGLSASTTNVGAIQIGQIALGEKQLPQRRGSMTITGYGWHPTAGPTPAWAIRAGDYVRVGDHPADEPRRIISTSYDHESQTNTLELDNSSVKLNAIVEWLGVSTGNVL